MAQKGLRNIAKKESVGRQSSRAQKKTETCSVNTRPCMLEENFLGSWLREDVAGQEEKRKRVNEEAKREESKKWKKRERVEIKRRCLNRVSSVPLRWWRVLRIRLGFRCVCLLCLRLCLM